MRIIALAAFSLITLSSCAKRPVEKSPQLGCVLPPEMDHGHLRAFCQEFVEQSTFGCGYVGYEDGKLCITILESKACGPWQPYARLCGVSLVVIPPPPVASAPDPTSTPAEPEESPSSENNFQEPL